MPSWWGNPFSKETRKQGNKDGVFHVQSLIPSPRRRNKKLEVEVESPKLPKAAAGIASASKHVSVLKGVGRCASFGSRPVQAQPLPLPGAPPSKRLGQKSNNASLNRYPSFPLPSPEQVRLRVDSVDIDGPEAEYGSGSSASSLASVDVADVWHPNMPPHIANLRIPATRESGGQTWSNITSTRGGKHKWELSRQGLSCPSSPLLRSNRGNPFSKGNTVQEDVSSQPHVRADVTAAASNSTLVSPARSPRKEQGQHNVLQPNHDTTSGQGSSPGSGHNSAGGELPPWYQARTSPELSPVPSPMRSPGPGSRVQSGSVSPLHPRVGGGDSETYRRHGEDNRGMGHRLPLPPATYSPASATLPSSPSASSVPPRSPSRMDNASTSGTRWQKGKLIGRGTFGNVYVGFDSENVGRMCAMKEVLLVSDDSKSKESAKQLGQEIALLSRLRHPNIVQYYGSETMEDRLYIYLEYVSGGSIHKLLHEYGPFKEPVICSYTRQILSGLAYLHSANTVHRDIKGANILVDTNGIVKLADFGMAKHITAQSFPLSFKGSPYWMAPEVIKPTHGYDLSVDIWSLGCTVLEMATAKPPWSQYEGVAAMFKIGNSKELPAIPDFLSKECKSFVKLCLQRNPSDRATAATLLMHPFVNSARPVSVPEDKVDAFDLMVSPSVGAGTYGGGYQNTIHDVENNSPRLQSRAWMQCSPPSDISPRGQAGFTSSSASPCASPKFRPLSPHHAHLGISSSQSSSPVISSGSSTPVTGGHGNLPFPGNGFYGAPSTFSHDGYYQFQKLSNGTHATGSPVGKVGLWSIPQSPGSPKQNEYVNSNTDILGLALGRVPREEDDYYERHHSGNGIVTDHIPQRLLKRSHRTFPMLYWQGSPMLSSNSANRGANQ